MNFFDSAILHFFNQGARQSWVFDQVVAFLSANNLLKGGVLISLVWWAWFRHAGPQGNETNAGRDAQDRGHILSTLLSAIVALALARGMVLTLPFRARPLHEPGLDWVLPYGVDATALDGMSSFPSDHAVLFFTLATGLLFISRRVGLWALVYAAVFIALPRIYLGLHHPTDILVGALLGAAIAWIGNIYLPSTRFIKFFTKFSHVQAGLFYPAFFLVSYQIADLFNASRDVVGGMVKMLKSSLL